MGVSAIDFVTLYDEQNNSSEADSTGGGSSRAVRLLRVPMRLLRVLRLFKLLRLLRASRLFRRWETRLSINYGVLTMVRFLCYTRCNSSALAPHASDSVTADLSAHICAPQVRCVLYVLLCAHWMACAWTLQTTIFAISPLQTWMGTYGYCREAPAADDSIALDALDAAAFVVFDVPDGVAILCVRHGELYAASLYWATLVTTGLGGGDLDSEVFNLSERVWSVILMLIGSLVWANVVATMCGVINHRYNDQVAFTRTSDYAEAAQTLPAACSLLPAPCCPQLKP